MAATVRTIFSEIEKKLAHAQSLSALVDADKICPHIMKNRDVITDFYRTISSSDSYSPAVSKAIEGYQNQLSENYTSIYKELSKAHKEANDS